MAAANSIGIANPYSCAGCLVVYLRQYLIPRHPLDPSLFDMVWQDSSRIPGIKQDTDHALTLHYGPRVRALIGFDVQRIL